MTELWDSRSYWNHLNAAPVGSITFWKGRETGRGQKKKGQGVRSGPAQVCSTRAGHPPLTPALSPLPSLGTDPAQPQHPLVQLYIPRFPAHRASRRESGVPLLPDPSLAGHQHSTCAVSLFPHPRVPLSPCCSQHNGTAPSLPSGQQWLCCGHLAWPVTTQHSPLTTSPTVPAMDGQTDTQSHQRGLGAHLDGNWGRE